MTMPTLVSWVDWHPWDLTLCTSPLQITLVVEKLKRCSVPNKCSMCLLLAHSSCISGNQEAATVSKLFISSLTSPPKESWLRHFFISWTDMQSNCCGFLWVFFFSYGFSFPDSTSGGKKKRENIVSMSFES